MKQKIKKLTAMLLAMLLVLCSCGAQEEPPEEHTTGGEHAQPMSICVSLGGVQDTFEPTYSTADGSETILYHLYENLMRWEDDGNGYAILAPGQAESYTVEIDYAGNATYTFTLREDIVWSDGQSVTSYQFAAAWQRLADPAYDSPHRELVSCIAGSDEVQNTGAASLLQVSTPDSRTLVVKLNGNSPCFLEVVCAGAYTMPIRTYLPGNEDDQIVTNGAYIVSEYSGSMTTLLQNGSAYRDDSVHLIKSETYYDAANVTVDEIWFVSSSGSDGDYAKFQDGSSDFVTDLPAAALEVLTQNENWLPEPVTTTYSVLFNTFAAPFDNADVRAAFRLAVDEQAIVDALADLTLRAATGLVPYGVADHGSSGTPDEEQTEEDRLPDPNAPPSEEEDAVVYYDFRAHGEEIVTMDISEGYEIDCTWARTLIAGAGYVGGAGFPEVEYIFVDTPENQLVAEHLRSAWQSVLGVTVTLHGLSEEEYAQMLNPTSEETENGEEVACPAFQIAAMELTCEYIDAYEFLSRWHSASAENICGYSSPAFDILLDAAAAATAPESYDAYLHDAEAILLQDAPVVPVFYRGGSFAIAEDLTGLYRAPNGVYFFSHLTKSVTE
ncbi:MAG: peptide ABC transporter substrate-binding protein [Oscillospiraceae bacterium]|nr:peptide ABC transporter substrate-binding protein [Oscillospiraceae bacterium]